VATIILVHGAWHGGWCWERLAPLLEQAGHEVLAPDLPGMGGGKEPLGDDPLGQWARFVAGLASKAGQPVVLVGHSRGGIIISEAAEQAPDAVGKLVYLAAFLLPAGQSLMDFAGRYPDVGPGAAIIPLEDRSRLMVDRERAIPFFYNGMDADDARQAAVRLGPEPAAALMTPVRVSEGRFGGVKRAYIETRNDRAISLAMQREMQAALPCDPVITLDCDHSPFYSAVPELAEALLQLARN